MKDGRFKLATAGVVSALVAGFLFYVQHGSPASPDRPYRGPPATPGPSVARPEGTRHIALNTEPADYPALRGLGYDLVDVKPEPGAVASVPDGMRALLWAGNSQCGPFELPFEEFAAAVRRLAREPKVFGWYLSDEPNARECPEVAGEIRRRADVVEREAPHQVSFISLTDFPMRPVSPARVNVDLVGLDPYPCKGASHMRRSCNIAAIDRMVRMADVAGIARETVVPVIQTFGQSCSRGDKNYWLPSPDQLNEILARWDLLIPNPPMDVSYSWGNQDEWACPTLADADGRAGQPDLQAIMRARNLRRG
ncbi:hypothetical protein [Spirillospora sp. CA-294931]|uniref:hypothetical protein n=1 Tax=Spirillospora sp. CA-294931 TaxID=3240042 RepID=UPI003D909510